ncbi:phosphoglycerate kinase [Nitrospirillum sp. BR 11164]|uniref:phosphoglycerate kinase n=2 Tax=Nitrospirillum TaxID=1543705 RepID=UPI002AFF6EDC|nr:phosphoglycerate kinase [Nitrospirillum sp. BR 11164]MEA1649367.1 phosphoglycerate kinase [Nitrospirillum sp. BR 11164]
MTFKTLDDIAPASRTVLVRADLNVPVQDGQVTDATRLVRLVPTLKELASKGAKVVVLSHFGRPKNGPDEKNSLRQVVPALSDALGAPVAFAGDCIGKPAQDAIRALEKGQVLVLENLRFHAGEEKNDPAFAAELAKLGDIYVNDAFSAAHRAHASTEALARLLPAAAGRLMQAELVALSKALGQPQRPVAAVVGGAKISTKLDLLLNLVGKVDILALGGGMANTFLYAQGVDVGASLAEKDMADQARAILAKAEAGGCQILLPKDGAVAKQFKAHAPSRIAAPGDIAADEMILDAGPATVAYYGEKLATAKTVVWNGPMGAFEIEPFDAATNAVAKIVADLTKAGTVLSVAGGGDTVAALEHAGVADAFSYISTAGGAFLEWLEGKELPGVKALEAAA